MKKLLTFLFVLSICVTTYGTQYTWNHAGAPAGGSWNTVTNWLPNGTPGSGDEVWFLLNQNMTVTLSNNITLEHMFIQHAGAAARYTLKLEGTTDGYILTFDNNIISPHDYDVSVGPKTTLDCNTANKRVKIYCTPDVRFLVDATNIVAQNGIFKPAIYEPCTGGKGFWLQASGSSHAELVQKLASEEKIRGWQDFQWATNKYHYVCAPVATDQVTILPPTYPGPPEDLSCWKANCLCFLEGNYARPYDVATQGWGTWYAGWQPCDVTLSPDAAFTWGQGYLVYALQNTSSVYGDFNANRDYSILLPVSPNAHEWSLIGNPYPSGVRFNWNSGSGLVGWNWSELEVDPWVAYWSNVSGPQTYYYNWFTNPPTAIPPQGPTNPSPNVIPRSQGFFVHTLVANATLAVKNDARQFVPEKQIGKSEEIAKNRLYLKLEDGINPADYVVVSFSENGDNNYSSQDILKMFANDPLKSEIYSKKADDKEVVSNTLPAANGNIAVPVYLNVGLSGTYTITAEQINSFGSNVGIILKDNKTNSTIDLKTTASYTFTASSEDEAGRFMLLFTDVLGVNNLSNNFFKVYSSGSSIYIQNNNSNSGLVTIYDMVGRELMNVNLSNDLVTRLSTSFATGYYIVSIKTSTGSVTQKVFIN